MCGLVSIFSYTSNGPSVSRSEMLNIRDHMIRRGPDGCGEWISKDMRVGLAHRRLAIIDVSDAGIQPMSSTDNQIKIVFNGMIYNYLDLRKQLTIKGHKFKTNTDTEVLLVGWNEWGENVVNHLRGMFAFALWDEKKKKLFIARDQFGIKPLYFSDNGKTIKVASQVKALLHGGGIESGIDPAGHVSFFLWGSVSGLHTLFEKIKEFPSGTSLTIDSDGRKRCCKFSSISNLILDAEEVNRQLSESEVREKLKYAVRDSVQKHLISDVKTGVFLSSGIDSCVMGSIASSQFKEKIHTLTLGFEEYKGFKDDEVPLAELMAKRIKSNHKTYWIGVGDFENNYSDYINTMDQPSIDGLNTWLVCKAAKDIGLKVAISGLGGDEFFGGYPSFTQIPKLVNRLKFLERAKNTFGRGSRFMMRPIIETITSGKYAGIFEYGTNFPGAYLLRKSLFMPWELNECLPSEIIKEGLPEVLDELYQDELDSKLSEKGKITILESTKYMKNQLLRDADWASMAHGLELRTPLVDLEILVSSSRADKIMLASTPKEPLPYQIKYRPKTGFSTPVNSWLSKDLELSRERGLRGWSKKLYKEFQDEY